MTPDGDPTVRRLSEEAVERVLARAAELDAGAPGGIPVDELRRAALEAGIGPEAFAAALAEVSNAELLRSRASRSGVSLPATARVPAWVRLCMPGVPDRRTAAGFYRLFTLGLCATPLLALTGSWTRPAAAAWALFLTVALWTTSAAVRWLDRHGRDTRS